LNYIKVIFFLVCSLCFWIIFGWLADYSFPFGQALELLLACFKGSVSAKINSLQQQLQRTDIVSQPDNPKQIQKLNNLESQAWLYEGILERLAEDSVVNHEKIARTLEALEYKRNEILQELEPRKPQRYRVLERIQDYARYLLASQAEKDYERLEKMITNLVIFTRTRQPSQMILSEVIERLASEIAQNANQISPYRLRLAYKIDELIKLLSAKLVFGSDNSVTNNTYQELVKELRSRIALLSNQFNSLLISKQENTNELNKRIQEIYNLTKNISDLHKVISDKEADLSGLRQNTQNLTELIRTKQSQIDQLQYSISNL
jgi:chromosome segregation ATPase